MKTRSHLQVRCNNLLSPVVDGKNMDFSILLSEYIEFDNGILSILNSRGEQVWRKTFGSELFIMSYDGDRLPENLTYQVEVQLMRDKEIVAYASSSFYCAFIPKKVAWIGLGMPSKNVLEFQKYFYIKKEVKQAVLCICGLGFFEAYINGRKTDDYYLKPHVTDYGLRDLSKNSEIYIGKQQGYAPLWLNVTHLLSPNARNIMKVFVGNGYYENTDRPEEPWISYGEKQLFFEFRITYMDGMEECIYSDVDTLVRKTNISSSLYCGDEVDFAKEERNFVNSALKSGPTGVIRLPQCSYDVLKEKIYPLTVKDLSEGRIFDFGINHSGNLAFKIKGTKGQIIKVRFAEVLWENGEPNFYTGRWEHYDEQGTLVHRIDQENCYILSGNIDEIDVLFSYHCYRYAVFYGLGNAQLYDLASCYIHGEIDGINSYSCDNNIVNEIIEKSERTLLDNFHSGILTDCPHREKRPYTGDGKIVQEAFLYRFNTISFYDKWITDLLNAQVSNGYVPHTAPYLSGGGGYPWGMAIATVPNLLYQQTGNIKYVQNSYPSIKMWIDFCESNAEDGIVTKYSHTWHLGEWMTPGMTIFNVSFMSSLCYYAALEIGQRFAEALGLIEDMKLYERKRHFVANAINKRFFNEENACYCQGIQGENILPLLYGIVPKKFLEKVLNNVREYYSQETEYHLDTGIVVTPYLFEVLVKYGMRDIAYKIITSTTYPSYYDMLQGETTLSENWARRWPDFRINDNWIIKGGGDLSHCHPMYASFVSFAYKYIAGLDISNIYRKEILFSPQFIGFMKEGKSAISTVCGYASIEWHYYNYLEMSVTIPFGCVGKFNFICEEKSLAVDGRVVYPRNSRYEFELKAGKWKICSDTM